MRKGLLFLALLSQLALAQVTPTGPRQGVNYVGGMLYASNFGQWQVPKGDLGQFSWKHSVVCQPVVNGITINAFTVGTPVAIVDEDNPALNETVTPSAVSTAGTCSISIAPVHGHNNFHFTSGTAGLQDALNWAGSTAYQVVLTPDWTLIGGTTAEILAATGTTAATILDSRAPCGVPYLWSGSAYVAQPSLCPGGTNVLPSGTTATTNISAGDASTQVATDQFVSNAIALSMARVPLAITGGTYSFNSQGSGALAVVNVSGGAVTSVLTWAPVGSGYAAGDLVRIAAGGPSGGNGDAVIVVTAVIGSGQPTAGTVLYGGTGYTSLAGNSVIAASSGRPFTYVFTGTLTSNAQIIMRHGTYLTASNQWIIANNTTGAFTLNVCEGGATDACAAGGATVTIAQGTANSRQVIIETDGELNMSLAAVQNSADIVPTTAAASNCNQGGVLTSVAGCMVVTVGGVSHYVPYF